MAQLLHRIKAETSLSVVLFTGFSWLELQENRSRPAKHVSQPTPGSAPGDVDVLIAGRYDQTQHLAQDLRGSANKTTYFLTNRYTALRYGSDTPAEVVITAEGDVIMSGIDPLKW